MSYTSCHADQVDAGVQFDADIRIAADDVARGNGGAADGVVGAHSDLNAITAVDEGDRASRIDADEVAFDNVAGFLACTAKILQENAVAGVAGDDVAVAGRCAAGGAGNSIIMTMP